MSTVKSLPRQLVTHPAIPLINLSQVFPDQVSRISSLWVPQTIPRNATRLLDVILEPVERYWRRSMRGSTLVQRARAVPSFTVLQVQGSRRSRRMLRGHVRDALSSQRPLLKLFPVAMLSDTYCQRLLFKSRCPVQTGGRQIPTQRTSHVPLHRVHQAS